MIETWTMALSPPLVIASVVPGIFIPKLSLWHSVAVRLSSLLAVRAQAGSRGFPGFTFAWLGNASRAIAVAFVGEWTTWSSRWTLLMLLLLGVNVVQTVHAALVVLSADMEVEAESCESGDTIL